MNHKPLLAFLAIAAASACARKSEPTREALESGMVTYLARRGNLCVGKGTWPIDVTPREFETGSRDAVQMPALEKVGLVTSSDADVTPEGETATVHVKRYRLTEEGKRYYVARDTSQQPATRDFCVAKLSLDRVVSWETSVPLNRATVTYTYFVDAPTWTADPSVIAGFPAVARVLGGAATAQLKESFVRTDHGWTAEELLDSHAVASR